MRDWHINEAFSAYNRHHNLRGYSRSEAAEDVHDAEQDDELLEYEDGLKESANEVDASPDAAADQYLQHLMASLEGDDDEEVRCIIVQSAQMSLIMFIVCRSRGRVDTHPFRPSHEARMRTLALPLRQRNAAKASIKSQRLRYPKMYRRCPSLLFSDSRSTFMGWPWNHFVQVCLLAVNVIFLHGESCSASAK